MTIEAGKDLVAFLLISTGSKLTLYNQIELIWKLGSPQDVALPSLAEHGFEELKDKVSIQGSMLRCDGVWIRPAAELANRNQTLIKQLSSY